MREELLKPARWEGIGPPLFYVGIEARDCLSRVQSAMRTKWGMNLAGSNLIAGIAREDNRLEVE